ncbi:helix-turn-helix transcriptional regulator [Schaalia sp. ZJ1691]|uniref:helix-turn-helix domain-containing protein n=1 Tax=Schaalia sp. ZJ1691 TaxID=2709404 RepID=UPI0013EB0D6D|nr:helix-turn-helix transcriptional regulator [Schaalia sp. ZJ1691]
MSKSQAIISREVRRFMDAAHLSQAELAKTLGIDQTGVSARLNGRTRWSLDDLDILREIGVPLELSAYDQMEAWA